MHIYIPVPPPTLTVEELLIFEEDPREFVIKYPERVVLKMEKTEDGSYQFDELGVVIR